jgi:hypothetical protein
MRPFYEVCDPSEVVPSIPEPCHLSLLRTCQLVRNEIGDSWLGQVSFEFKECETMLDVLTPLPRDIISKIRHVRVIYKALLLNLSDASRVSEYRLAAILTLLPGLELDVLSAHSTERIAEVEGRKTLDEMVTAANGWKQFEFTCEQSMLSNVAIGAAALEQPLHWHRILQTRDKMLSGSSVEIFRAKQENSHWSDVLDPSKRGPFKQSCAESWSNTVSDSVLQGWHKSMLVIVKRGKGANYVGSSSAVSEDQDIWRDTGVQTWADIKASFIDAWPDDNHEARSNHDWDSWADLDFEVEQYSYEDFYDDDDHMYEDIYGY